MGIFRVEFLRDPDFNTFDYVIGNVDNIPPLSVNSPSGAPMWNKAKLKSSFKLAVILSVVFAIPNNNGSKHIVGFELKNGAGNVIQHIHVRSETARFGYKDAMSARIGKGGEIEINGASFVNEDVVSAIAKGEAERLKFSWEDRILGIFSLPGWEESWTPFAWCNSVTLEYTAEEQLNTIFNMTEPPEPFDIITTFPQYVKNIINKSPELRAGI
jgi:hypothetical protein